MPLPLQSIVYVANIFRIHAHIAAHLPHCQHGPLARTSAACQMEAVLNIPRIFPLGGPPFKREHNQICYSVYPHRLCPLTPLIAKRQFIGRKAGTSCYSHVCNHGPSFPNLFPSHAPFCYNILTKIYKSIHIASAVSTIQTTAWESLRKIDERQHL